MKKVKTTQNETIASGLEMVRDTSLQTDCQLAALLTKLPVVFLILQQTSQVARFAAKVRKIDMFAHFGFNNQLTVGIPWFVNAVQRQAQTYKT